MTTENIDIRIREDGSRVVTRNLREMAQEAMSSDRAVGLLKKSLLGLASGFAISQLIREATTASREFGKAVANVNTLLDDTPGQLDKLTKSIKEQAVAFGSDPTKQAEAMYQVLSAGATDAADAMKTLEAANKLAVGGVTDVFVAADGLTSVMGAYGDAVGSATEVSDSMFIAAKAGKTSINELASSLGKVAPLAATMGVSLDELNSSIAALTNGGISTSEAVTGMRAILAAVAKPSKEAADMAKSLGLEFNSAGVKAKGFTGFLKDLTEKTGGSMDKMAVLFGGVEALVPVLALAGNAGEDFAKTLEMMKEKGGATEEAFRKITESGDFQMNRLAAVVKTAMIDIGDSIMNILAPAAKFIADNFDNIAKAAAVLGAALLVAFAPEIIALIGVGLTGALSLATGAVWTLTAAIASNPLGALLVAITAGITALVMWRDEISVTADGLVSLGDVGTAVWEMMAGGIEVVTNYMGEAWDTATAFVSELFAAFGQNAGSVLSAVANFAKNTINAQIGFWVFAFNSILSVWRGFPAAFVDFVLSAVNGAIGLLEGLINKSVAGVNRIIGMMNSVNAALGGDAAFVPEVSAVALGRVSNSYAGAGRALGREIKANFIGAMKEDYVGDFTNDVMAKARAASEKRRAAAAAKPTVPKTAVQELGDAAGGADGKGGKGGGADGEDKKPEETEAMKLKAQLLKEITGYQTDYNMKQQALNELLKEGSITNEQYAAAFDKIRVEYLLAKGGIENGIEAGLISLHKTAQDTAKGVASAIGQMYNEIRGYENDYMTKQQALDALLKNGSITNEEYATSFSKIRAEFLLSQGGLMAGVEAGFLRMHKSSKDLATEMASFTESAFGKMGDAMAEFVLTGKADFKGLVSSILSDLARMLMKYLITQAIIKATTAMFGGGFANGGAFSGGSEVTAFANGGVVSSPTMFGMSGGRVGLMGEAGAEAIMPLRRTKSGRLGVELTGAHGGGSSQNVFSPSVVVNVESKKGEDSQKTGDNIGKEVNRQLEQAMAEFVRKQQRPMGMLNAGSKM
jgi:TP901 family phage tail tape measure protein/lambda family phage tail tape measure protein